MKHTPTNTRPDRVIKEDERIYEALDTLLGRSLTRKQLKEAASYVMEYSRADWYNGYRQGLVSGRKEALAMVSGIIGEDEEVPKYGSTDTKHTDHVAKTSRNNLKAEQRTRYQQALEAVEEGKQ
jgi:hypothetical protein